MKIYKRQAFSILEYIFVLLLVISSLIVMGAYIHRGMQGQYRRAGESFSDFRQHDPHASQDCNYDDQLGIWYSEKCFDHWQVPFCRSAGSDDVNSRAYCHANVRQCAALPAINAEVVRLCPYLCCEQTVKMMCRDICLPQAL